MAKSERAKMTLVNAVVRKISLAVFAVFICAPFSAVSSQTAKVESKFVAAPFKQNFIQRHKKAIDESESAAEKSIAVDAKVNINLCVIEGSLKITGWERSEIRVFVVNGGDVSFNVREKNTQNKAVLLTIKNSGAAGNSQTNSRGCLSGERLELDVPRGATVNVESETSETTIEAVRKVVVKNVGGDISLYDIEQGIHAVTYEGDVMVENSGGAVTLESGNGSILALDVAPKEIGDIFKAKTSSGAITLQNIGHRQTEINSNSGSIKYTGSFRSGGQYNFGTQNGTISLAIPEKSSFKVTALYGLGRFNSELKHYIIAQNNTSKTQSISATFGSGDANVDLRTYSGAIRIKKQ